MKIALISDIHDNIWNLSKALKAIEGADVLLCLGDLCSPFIIPRLEQDFAGKPIHIILGNNDGDLLRIARNAAKFPNIHLEGEFFQGDLGGMKIAAVHYDNMAEPLVQELMIWSVTVITIKPESINAATRSQ